MDDIVSSPPTPNPRKRPAPDDEAPENKPLNIQGTQFLQMATPDDTEESSNASPTETNLDGGNRAGSLAPSDSTASMVLVSSNTVNSVPGSSALTGSGSSAPPAKRRKKTPSEKLDELRLKEEKQRERAEKKAQQEEEKARKDEEKARKDEEKARKDEEKRAKAEEKEFKRREKEHAEELKGQEKLKKERAQMRLGAFFQAKPATPGKTRDTAEGHVSHARRKSLSLEPYDHVADQLRRSTSPAKGTPPKPVVDTPPARKTSLLSDYHKTFLPFEVQVHTTLAPMRKLPENYEAHERRLDLELNDPSLHEKYDLGLVSSYASVEHHFGANKKVQRGLWYPGVDELACIIEGTAKQPIDLTADHPDAPLETLRKVPIKHIHFSEDVRPAYHGTYTKIYSPRASAKMRRNPHTRGRPDTNYDEDSEAEWEEPEEGDEEIVSDDDDESEKDEGDEIEGFLDDSDDTARLRRKAVTAELVPDSTGLCWADDSGRCTSTERIAQMRGMSVGLLIPGLTGLTIDPLSTEYWSGDLAVTPTTDAVIDNVPGAPIGLMAPPRPPLHLRPNSSGPAPEHDLLGAVQGEKGPITSVAAQGTKRGPKAAPKVLSTEDLEEFKEAVVGSPIGKLALLKGLKERFPKITNDTIKDTLSSHFAQVGLKTDKKWVYVGAN